MNLSKLILLIAIIMSIIAAFVLINQDQSNSSIDFDIDNDSIDEELVIKCQATVSLQHPHRVGFALLAGPATYSRHLGYVPDDAIVDIYAQSRLYALVGYQDGDIYITGWADKVHLNIPLLCGLGG